MSSSTDNYKTKSPVLLLLFNRPDETIKLIDALSKVRPQKIYISIDGNREGNKDDIKNQAQILDIINEKIHWTKEVSINKLTINFTLFNPEGRGNDSDFLLCTPFFIIMRFGMNIQ